MSWLFALLLSMQAAPNLPPVRTPATPESWAPRVAAAQAEGPLGPQAQRLMDAFDKQLGELRHRHVSAGPSKSIAEELGRRRELDQFGRRFHVPSPGFSRDMDRVQVFVTAEMLKVDADNTAYLKTVLPPEGWFRKSVIGERAAKDAFLLVQHSADVELQKRVVARMEPLVRAGEVSAADYALLYDRTEAEAGRPQRFGSQVGCVAGKFDFLPIEQRSGVDARRRAVGLMQPLTEYARNFPIGRPC